MGSIQLCSDASIEGTFAMPPMTRRDRRGSDTASGSISAKQTNSETMCSSFSSISSVTASVKECSSSLIQNPGIEGIFCMGSIPGGIKASGSDSVNQAVDVKFPKNESAIVGREGERQHSKFDHGSMSWFAMCFKGRVEA